LTKFEISSILFAKTLFQNLLVWNFLNINTHSSVSDDYHFVKLRSDLWL
jgi:hypothetical protein